MRFLLRHKTKPTAAAAATKAPMAIPTLAPVVKPLGLAGGSELVELLALLVAVDVESVDAPLDVEPELDSAEVPADVVSALPALVELAVVDV